MKLPKPTNPKNMCTYHIKEMLFESRFKNHLVTFCVCMALFLFIILIAILPFIINQKRTPTNHRRISERFPTDLKYILFWKHPKHKNPFQRDYLNEFENGQRAFIDQKCPHINCYISYNKSSLDNDESNFDAIVFDVHEISKFKSKDFNVTKNPNQIYIFRSHEASEKQPICNPVFDDFFTYTWTYKLDSDIPHPFMSIYDVNNKLVGPSIGMKWVKTMNHSESITMKTRNKKKAVAWIVTRCRLKHKHQEFYNKLKKELAGYNYSVDVFGPCGDNKCPEGSLSNCYKMIERDYYFQLVLEDAFSEDYVGENIVKALSYLSVPIVLGGADYTRFLPPGTYINAKAFDIKKIGALIDYLIHKPVMYRYFFDWKNHYFYTVKHKSQVCDLCTKLNNESLNTQTLSNFREWWHPESDDVCERMHLVKMFNSY